MSKTIIEAGEEFAAVWGLRAAKDNCEPQELIDEMKAYKVAANILIESAQKELARRRIVQ